jgi:hypothetical protein
MGFGSPESCRRFPLSPSEGERAGVRGPLLPCGSGAQSASNCRGVLSPIRNSHSSRSGPVHHQKEGGPDLSFNSPNPSTLCNLTPRKATAHREPNWLTPAVVTWTALRPRPAKQFGSREPGGTERRKAMETLPITLNCTTHTHSRGGQNAERQWRLAGAASALIDICFSRGGQNAERQWRPGHSCVLFAIPPIAGGDRTPKGNGDSNTV